MGAPNGGTGPPAAAATTSSGSFVPPAEINTGHNRRALYVVPPDLLRLCKTCRVCAECLAVGERDRYAIRGGTTAQSREAARRKQRR